MKDIIKMLMLFTVLVVCIPFIANAADRVETDAIADSVNTYTELK